MILLHMLAGIGAVAFIFSIFAISSRILDKHNETQKSIEQQRVKAVNDLYNLLITSPDEVLINCLRRPDANEMLIREVKKELSRRGVEWQ